MNRKYFERSITGTKHDAIHVFHFEDDSASAVFHLSVVGNSAAVTYQVDGSRSDVARTLWKWRHNFGKACTEHRYF